MAKLIVCSRFRLTLTQLMPSVLWAFVAWARLLPISGNLSPNLLPPSPIEPGSGLGNCASLGVFGIFGVFGMQLFSHTLGMSRQTNRDTLFTQFSLPTPAISSVGVGSFEQFLVSFDPDPHVRGKQFEKAVNWLLLNDPKHKRKYKNVWLWDESAFRTGPDIGLDVVAQGHDNSL